MMRAFAALPCRIILIWQPAERSGVAKLKPIYGCLA